MLVSVGLVGYFAPSCSFLEEREEAVAGLDVAAEVGLVAADGFEGGGGIEELAFGEGGVSGSGVWNQGVRGGAGAEKSCERRMATP